MKNVRFKKKRKRPLKKKEREGRGRCISQVSQQATIFPERTLCVHCTVPLTLSKKGTWTTIFFNLGCKFGHYFGQAKKKSFCALNPLSQQAGRMYLTADGKMYAKHLLKRVLYCRKFCSGSSGRKRPTCSGSHMWLMGCPNPYELQQNWTLTFIKVFTNTKTK